MDLDYTAENCENTEDLMRWTQPEHTKKAVSRAGDVIIDLVNQKDYEEALVIVNNWRASHACPLNSIQCSLRYRANKVTTEALISQRLKRIPSIRGKLRRFPEMKLHRMQDIGGCRAVLPNLEQVYSLKELMIDSRLRSELTREYDYIIKPKDSGYRGIHLIYKYKGKKDSLFDGHLIEVQIRSSIQHAWATSVEIAGTFLGSQLKAGYGTPDWLRFFSIVSILFSNVEGCIPNNLNPEDISLLREEAIQLERQLSITGKLEAFSVATEYGNQYDKPGYFLLALDVDRRRISVNHYEAQNLERATAEYVVIEERYRDSNVDVVLVAAESIWSLKKAYPNYFADSELFLQTLDIALGV
jgi:hypothetical protein